MSGAVVSEMLIRIAADTAQLRSQMEEAKKTVTSSFEGMEKAISFAKTALIGFIGISSLNGLKNMVLGVVEANGALHDMSIVTGMSVAALKEFKSLGALSETSIDTIVGATTKLSRTMATTADDTKGAGLAIKALGINFNEFKAMTPEQQMLAVAGAMNKFEDGSGKSAAAMMLFGRSGAQMLPFLKDLGEEADHINQKLDEQTIAAAKAKAAMADAYGDNMVKITKQSQAWKKEVGEAMLPVMYEASEAFLKMAGGTGGLKEEISKLAKDGTFAEWGRSAITVIAYVVDVVQGLLSVIPMVGKAVAAVMASTSTMFGAISDAYQKLKSGDLSGAWESMKAGVTGVREVAVVAGEDISSIWGQKLLGQTFRDRMADMKGMQVASGETKDKLHLDAEETIGDQAKQLEAYKKLIDGIHDKTGAMQLELDAGAKLTSGQQTALKVMQDIQNSTVKLTDAQKQAVTAALEQMLATERLNEDRKNEIKLAEDMRKLREEDAKAAQKEADAVEAELKKQEDANDVLRYTKQQLAAIQVARLDERIAIMETVVAQDQLLQACTKETAAHADTLEALKKLKSAREEGVGLELAKEQADEWKKTADSIYNGLTDSLYRAFESGKNFFKTFWDGLVNTFKTTVLKLAIQGVVGGVTGLGASGASAGTGGIGGISSLFSAGKSAWDYMSGGGMSNGLSGMWGSVTNSSIGQQLGLSSMVDNGVGGFSIEQSALGSSLGTAGAYLGAGAAGIGLGSMIGGKYSIGGSNSTTSAAIGTAIGAAVAGPIGAIIGGALGGLANRAFGMGSKDYGDKGITGSLTGGVATGQTYANWHQDGGWFRSDRNGTDTGAFGSDVQGMLNAGAGAIYDQTKKWAEALKLPAEALATVTTDFKVKLTGNVQEDQQAITTMMEQYQSDLTEQFRSAIEPFQIAGEKLVDTMQRMVVLDTFSNSIRDLGGIFSKVADSSYNARQSLVEMAGGLDNLVGQINSFVKDYYTQSEQAGLSAKAIADALKAVGIDAGGLMTREDFRALVESRDVNTEQGRQQLAALLSLGPQFAQLADYMKQNGIDVATAIQNAPTTGVLTQMVDPAQTTATAVTSMATSVDTSNKLLTTISITLDGINAGSKAAVDAANAAVTAAQAAAKAAQDAATTASLASSATTYKYDIGGA